jgi:cell surface protein SprA
MTLRLKTNSQQASSSVDYAFSFQPKPIEPFKKMEFMKKKSDYWKLLSDFNFNYLPSNISFNTNINRTIMSTI